MYTGRRACRLDRVDVDAVYRDTGDLEPATRTITATSRPATPDYSASLALIDQSADMRVFFMAIGVRFQLVIDSMTAGRLNYEVYEDDTLILQGYFTGTGTRTICQTISYGSFYFGTRTWTFYFWVDTGNAVLSLVELWVGLGTSGIVVGAYMGHRYFARVRPRTKGWFNVTFHVAVLGTGTPYCTIRDVADHSPMNVPWEAEHAYSYGGYLDGRTSWVTLCCRSTVDTDLVYVRHIRCAFLENVGR